jgi:hypothetical protein
MVERVLGKDEVVGSIPTNGSSSSFRHTPPYYSCLARLSFVRLYSTMAKFRSFARQAFYLCTASITLTMTALAAPSVATVTSAVPFVLDGHSVTSPGVTSFPLVPGDTVATTNGPAVLLFHDGSTVKLGENSSAKIDTVGENPKVILLAGALDYKLVGL